jgi:hypothetical protein
MRPRSDRSSRTVRVAAVALALGVTTQAQAQTAAAPGGSKVAAEALFEDGRSLVAEGKYAEACPKFADSERLGPSVSTLLNLANCWEKLGRTATAWATYREAASAANAEGRKDYLTTALRRADGLSPKLARMTLTVAQPPPGLQIKRDGVVVDSAEWGTGIPVDAGPHSVEATAPGRKPWSVTVDVAQDGIAATVSIPALDELPPDASPSTASGPAPEAPAASPSIAAPAMDAVAPKDGGTQRVVGIVVAAAGLVTAGAGGILALGAKSKYNDSLKNCEGPGNPDLCTGTGVSQRDDARSEGNVATVLVGVGAAVFVAGGITWLTAPHGSRPSAAFQVLPTLGGVVARGAW